MMRTTIRNGSLLGFVVVLTAVSAYWSTAYAGYLGHGVRLTREVHGGGIQLVGEPIPITVLNDFGTRTAGPGVEFPGDPASLFGATGPLPFDVDVADESIRFGMTEDYFGEFISIFDFDGFRLADADGSLPDIIGVSVGSDLNVGLSPSRISFDADNIFIDLKEMFIDSGFRFQLACPGFNPPPGISQCFPTIVETKLFDAAFILDVRFASVPEPGTTLLLSAGVFLLLIRRRRS